MLLNTVLSSTTARQLMQLSEDLALLWLASGQDFQNTPRPAVPYFHVIYKPLFLLKNCTNILMLHGSVLLNSQRVTYLKFHCLH